MDLGVYEFQESAECVIYDPFGEEIGKIVLKSTDSPEWKKNMEFWHKKIKNRRDKSLSMDEAEIAGLDLLAGLVLSWEGFMVGGKELECTKENVKRVFKDYPFIKEQVDEFAGDRTNFLLKK